MGLIAGWGRYPIAVAQELKRQGRRVVCVGLRDHADGVLRDICDVYKSHGLAQLGGAIRTLRRHRVRTATMAGKVHKTLLFQRFFLVKHRPDWEAVRTFFPHFVTRTADRKDDTLLGAVVQAFARHGITMTPATDFVPELLVKPGILTHRRPTPAQCKDIEFAWQIAKDIGRLDIGQSVAVKGRAVLAVEAVEGTDRCIQRAGELCESGGFSVVKVAKPQQDMRFDVPTIGLGTLETLLQAGGTVLAVEAEKTILVDEPAVMAFANQHGLAIVAVHDRGAATLVPAA